MIPQKIIRSFVSVSIVLFVSGCVSNVIYHPERTMRCTPAFAGLIYEEIRVETQDGISISGWWVPTVRPKGTVLFCHGNGGNIASYLDSILLGNRLGLDVFIFDYRGYGYSGGTPTESGTYLDADAAWKYLVTERGIAPEQIIVWGRSLGGAIAARTAAVHPAGLVIVESTFTSLRDLVNDRFSWVPSCIVADYAYDTRHHLEQVYVPVLVIHSPDDEMIPFRHGKMLYDAIKGPKAFLEIKGSHNRGYLDSMDVYVSGIMDFVSRYMENEEVSK